MPEKFIAEAKIKNLTVGSLITDWSFAATSERPTGKITEIDPKDKFTYFKVEGDSKRYRFAHECMAKVERERLTPEEEEIRRRERLIEAIDEFESRHERWFNEIRKEIGTKIAAGYDVSHFDYDRLHRHDAEWEIWREVQRVHLAVTQRLLNEGPIEHRDELTFEKVVISEFTRADAVYRVAMRCKKQLLQNGRFVNNSTSSMSNLLDAYKYQAWADFINEVEGPFGQLGRYGG